MTLNISTPLNDYVTNENMVFNPLEHQPNHVFQYEFSWNMMLVEELLHRRIETVLQLSGINNASITFVANFYQVSSTKLINNVIATTHVSNGT